jgi:beta-glucosidase
MIELRVDEAPAGPIALSVGSGDVDIGENLRAARGAGWTRLAVRLSCFARAGADMSAVQTPLSLESSGRLVLGVTAVRLAPGEGQAVCPTAIRP